MFLNPDGHDLYGRAVLYFWSIKMDKQEMTEFLRFLNEGKDEEIEAKQDKLLRLLKLVNKRGQTAADIRFCLRLIDQELVARNEVAFHHKG